MMWTIAGISNWETYYYNTDITQFCPNYLGFTPVDDKAIYELTSPMTRIHDASTPTLIQHGELDQRGVRHDFLSTCWNDSYGAALLCI
jgi:dipeptidyl aminopeptidase/acylaminoacyl peptidase